MPSNLIIVPRNFFAEGTVAASTEDASFPITNAQNSVRDDAWRSTDTTTTTVTVTWSRAKTVSFFAMDRHRCHGGNIRVQLFTDAAWTTPASGGDTTTVAVNKVVGSSSDAAYDWGDDPYGVGGYDPLITESPFWYYFTPVSVQSAKITLSSHSATFWNVAYWQVSSFVFGNYFETSVNPDYGATLGVGENGTNTRTGGGSRRGFLGFRWRKGKYKLSGLSEKEAATLLQITQYCQTGRPVYVSLFPGAGTLKERDNMFPAFLASLDEFGRQVSRIEKYLSVEEA